MKWHLENVNTVRKRLKSGGIAEYHYHRKTGKRIIGEPGTREFLDSYEAAGEAEERNSETLNSLILAYQASAEFSLLAASSQQRYRALLQRVSDRWGKHEIAAFEDKRVKADILAWRDSILKSGTPAAAQNVISIMKTLLKWGEKRGILSFNILQDMERIYNPDRKGHVWDLERLQMLFRVAPPELQWGAVLALTTLQRQSDLVRMKWPFPGQREFSITQEKTHAPVIIPIFGPLEDALQRIPKRSETILTNARGRKWRPDTFRRAWCKKMSCDSLRGLDLHFHDLRGTAITVLADQGATEAEIAALSGHALRGRSSSMKHYLSQTATQARNAMAKLQASWIGQLPTIMQTA